MHRPFCMVVLSAVCCLLSIAGCQKSSQQEFERTQSHPDWAARSGPDSEPAQTPEAFPAASASPTPAQPQTTPTISSTTETSPLPIATPSAEPSVATPTDHASETAARTSSVTPSGARSESSVGSARPGKELAALSPSKTKDPKIAATPAGPVATGPARSILVVGDSFAVGIGQTLAQALKGRPDIVLRQKGKISTGLNSPKFYNWEARLTEFIKQEKPEVLVAMVSGNDAHNGQATEAWKSDYTAKVSGFLKIAEEQAVPVCLVGLPPMGKNPDYSQRARLANEALQAACSSSGGCTYVDSWRLFSDDKGEYTQKKDLNGKTVALRAGDGVHFTMNGYYLLSRQIIESIQPRLSERTP